MPKFTTHVLIGGGVGFATYCVKHNLRKAFDPTTTFDWGSAFVWASVGVAAACVPDLLEPAISPNHRGFFHSFALLAVLLWYVFVLTAGTLSASALCMIAALGYVSHLLADGFTPRSLPWI